MSGASKWQPIDTAPIGVEVLAKVEGVHPITGEPYGKAKVMLSHGVRGVIATKTKGSGHEGYPIKEYDGYSTCWPITHWKPVKQSKWKPIDTAPVGVEVWAKMEGTHPITGEPYGKAKVMFANHPTKGVVVTHSGVNYPNWLPIAGDLRTQGNWPLTHWSPIKQSKWIVKNSKHIPIKDMSKEDAAEVFDAWRELQYIPHSNLQMWFELDNKWIVVGAGWHLTPIDIFRVKRKKSIEEGHQEVSESADNPTPNVPLWEVDWEEIPREYEWAAVDESGRAWLYEERPYTVGNIWDCHADMRELSISEIVFVLGAVENNWKDSLIHRHDENALERYE